VKDLILGLLIGGIIGLWFGVNLGKEQALMSNPFAGNRTIKELTNQLGDIQQNMSKKTQEIYDDSKKAVDEAF